MEATYRVWHVINLDKDGIGKHSFQFPVDSVTEAARLIYYMSEVELKFPDRVIGSNVFGLEHFEDGEWSEWSDDIFEDIDELVDSLFDTEST